MVLPPPPSPVVITKLSLDLGKCPLGDKIIPTTLYKTNIKLIEQTRYKIQQPTGYICIYMYIYPSSIIYLSLSTITSFKVSLQTPNMNMLEKAPWEPGDPCSISISADGSKETTGWILEIPSTRAHWYPKEVSMENVAGLVGVLQN